MKGRMETIYTFGEWRLDTRLSELRCAGKPVKLGAKVLDVLLYLIEHRDRVVSNEDLMAHVWPGQLIDHTELERCIVETRQAVGDSARVQRYIRTLRELGYRFVAPVEEHVDARSAEEAQATSLPSRRTEGSAGDEVEATPTPPPLPREQAEPRPGGPVLSPQTMRRDGHLLCPQCEQENGLTANFCGACGASLESVCPSCGHAESRHTRHCSACGSLITRSLPITSPAAAESRGDPSGLQGRLGKVPSLEAGESEAERRHLTLLFCDLVDSTPLATLLDPEELREVVRAYHTVCAGVIESFDGHIAQYLGDGLLVYFGYPRAHEDDAQRAVRTGLGVVDALRPLQTRLRQEQGVSFGVRVGIHTGLVVVGDMGEGARHERLALGEAPNLAARLQGLAAPDTVLISGSTARLVQGWFVCEALGDQALKGFLRPMPVYRVLGESGVQSRLDMVSASGLTPLVGREQELKLLLEHWERAKGGQGQVVVLSGEAGIGKSRLVRAVQDCLAGEPYTRLECRCSPYAQHSALYPVIDLGRRLLQWQRDEVPEVTLGKLEAALAPYDLALPEVVPLLASLLSLPLSEHYTPPQLTPQRQKQKTLETILALLLAQAAQQPVLFIVEDLQWADASTLELLALFIDQKPTARFLTLFTCRPEFHLPWGFRAHMASFTLGHLSPTQVELMVDRVTEGKRLPAEVRQQIVAKTDGVPLFVEELTKMVLESGILQEQADHYELRGPLHSLDIPTTLHDSLMARLDRLADAKEVAQLGAILGRTFPFELLRAVSPWDEPKLQRALTQLVDAELLHQRGVPPKVTYIFKHALIQETAYQSLLKRQRQHYHQRAVHVMEQQFGEIAETQPELLAYHHTEAGLPAQALPYWQRAGQRAIDGSANVEAISHLTKGLEVLKLLPDTLARTRQELALQLALGQPLRMIKGHATAEVEAIYTRIHELSQQVGDDQQQFSALVSLSRLHLNRARVQKAREMAEQCLALAQSVQNPAFLLEAHRMLGQTLFWLGDLVTARRHLEQGIALYEVDQGYLRAFGSTIDPGVACLSALAWTLWMLGYPDRAVTKIGEAITLAQGLSHAYSLAFALNYAATLHGWRREVDLVKERAEAVITLSHEHGFIHSLSVGTIKRGWAEAQQGAVAEGLKQLHEGLAAGRDTGTDLSLSRYLAMLTEAYRLGGQVEEGLQALAEALAHLKNTGERHFEAELYRLKGECLLAQTAERCQEGAAEECFRQALRIARQQQAKSLELRAAMSLGRLRQQQGRRTEAHQLLAEVYGFFTEGFETPDVQEAKALIEAWQ